MRSKLCRTHHKTSCIGEMKAEINGCYIGLRFAASDRRDNMAGINPIGRRNWSVVPPSCVPGFMAGLVYGENTHSYLAKAG